MRTRFEVVTSPTSRESPCAALAEMFADPTTTVRRGRDPVREEDDRRQSRTRTPPSIASGGVSAAVVGQPPDCGFRRYRGGVVRQPSISNSADARAEIITLLLRSRQARQQCSKASASQVYESTGALVPASRPPGRALINTNGHIAQLPPTQNTRQDIRGHIQVTGNPCSSRFARVPYASVGPHDRPVRRVWECRIASVADSGGGRASDCFDGDVVSVGGEGLDVCCVAGEDGATGFCQGDDDRVDC